MSTYRLLEKIGEGSYSQVFKAINQLAQQIVAIKIIQFKDAPQHYVLSRQIKILKDCNHPNIAPLLQYFQTERSIYLVFEYFSMNLSEYYRYFKSIYNKNLDINQITHLMIQISSAIAYLHSKHIIHRDIKPENIMIDPNTKKIKIIDFGFARYKDQHCYTGYMVTRWYRPLQIVLGLPYDQKVDIFALGCIFLQLINSQQIFRSESNLDQMYQLLNLCGFPQPKSRQAKALQTYNIVPRNTNQLRFYTNNLNDSLKKLIVQMLSNSPEKRPSIQHVLQVLLSKTSEYNMRTRRKSLLKTKKRVLSVSHGLTLISPSCYSTQKNKTKKNEHSKKYEYTCKLQDKSIQIHPRFCKILG